MLWEDNGNRYYVFRDVAFSHDGKTNLSVYNKPNEYYSIEAILAFWRGIDAPHTAYVKDVSGKGIQPVTRMQRRDVIDFLKGEKPLPPKDIHVLAPVAAAIPLSRFVNEEEETIEPNRKRPHLDQTDKGIDKIMDHNTEDEQEDNMEVRGLSNELPAEKIALLRTRVKKQIQKNNVVRTLQEESYPTDVQMPDASSDSVGRYIKTKERTWKNRVTCLESHYKNFSSVLSVLSSLKNRDRRLTQNGSFNTTSTTNTNSRSAQGTLTQTGQNGIKPAPRTSINTGYSRYDQEIFQKAPIADFQIETGLSFHGILYL